MSSKLYDVLKYIQRIVLPAVVVLITTLGKILAFDSVTVCAVISAVDVFLGAILQIDYNKYKGGMT